MNQTTTQPIGHEHLNLLPDAAIVAVVRAGLPVFVCERNGKGGLSFKCPACKQRHHHRAGAGLRKPHCFAKPPVHPQGYYLLEPLTEDGIVAVATIKRTKVEGFLKSLNGRMFGIDFIKQDKSFRSLTGRLGVKPLKGGVNKVEAFDRPYITVHETAINEYRTVNLDTALRIRAQGKVFDIVD